MAELGVLGNAAIYEAGVALFQETLGWAVTLVAAFAGAYFAFRFQAAEARSRHRRESQIACNMAVLTLMRQWNWLALYKRQVLDEHEKHPLRFVLVQGTLQSDAEIPSIDLSSLAFLADTTGPSSSLNATMLFELKLAEEEFRGVRQAVVQRSAIRANDLEPAMQALGLRNGDSTFLSISDIRAALGESKLTLLRQLTDHAYTSSETMARILAVKDDLRAAMRRLYPDAKSYDFSEAAIEPMGAPTSPVTK